MALKKPTILSVDTETNRVTYIEYGSTIKKTDRWSFLSKNAKTATLSFMGHKFVGKPPMHFTNDEIDMAYIVAKRSFVPSPAGSEEPVPPTESEIPLPPTPKPQPKPTTSSTGGLDDILRGVVAEVLGDFVPEVDPAKVASIVSTLLTPTLTTMTEATSQVAELRSAIDRLRPKVTEIHLTDREVVKLDGIQHHQFPKVLSGIANGEHLYLVGQAGTGKSTIAENASKSLGLDFASKSCSSQSTEASLLGYMSATGNYVGTQFREAYEKGFVFLLDEVDNGNPNILTVLNSALSNTFMAFPDGMVKRHKNFVLIATANTFGNGATSEYVGRNALDKAFMDRFTTITVGYDSDVEQAMLDSVSGLDANLASKWLTIVRRCRANVETYGLKVIVSPRATLKGAKLLRDKDVWNLNEVLDATVLAGCKDDQRAKIMEGITL
jgi:cobaltochelatase CobS